MNALLLFDFDGVLADSLDFYADAVTRALARIGTPIVRTPEEYVTLFEGNFYATMAARGVDLEAFGRAAKEILGKADYGVLQPFPDLLPVLKTLHREHTLAIVSSNGFRTISAMIERFGFAPFFDDILGSDFLFSKTEKIDHARGKYGTPPERTFYIGDTVGDILEAKEAGVKAVAVTWGWHGREQLLAAAPDAVADRPADLLTLVAG
ncbi:MAG: HAD family hydrolase [Deltaproteobacteria bacterium]|nr:HAD family hydrolase [Deltaproteobacteria bacterium]